MVSIKIEKDDNVISSASLKRDDFNLLTITKLFLMAVTNLKFYDEKTTKEIIVDILNYGR